LSHELFRSGGVPKSERLASLEGSVDGGGTVRDSVGEVGSVVAVHGTSGPWGRPHGPMEILVVWRIAGAPIGPGDHRDVVGFVFFFFSLLLRLMTRLRGPKPRCNPVGARSPIVDSARVASTTLWRGVGLRVPSVGTLVGQGKGTGPL
jgi:hypothetical protein